MPKQRPQFRYRRGWWGRLILQIRPPQPYPYSGWWSWRDAKLEDLSQVTNILHAMEGEK